MRELRIGEKSINAFLHCLKEEEKSAATIEKYLRDVRNFCVFSGEAAIEKNIVLAYKAELGRRYAPASANSMLAAVNAFFRFAGRRELCVKQFSVQRKTYCSEEKEISKGEYLALVRMAEKRKNERLALLLQTLCVTGIRVGELKYITVAAVRRGEATVTGKGKTRTVFLPSALRKKLLRYLQKRRVTAEWVFATQSGAPMNRSNIWREMKALCAAAGVSPKKVFPHNLRHLFARTFYALEKDIAKLADILGHSNIATTQIYLISTGAEHRRKIERMRLIS